MKSKIVGLICGGIGAGKNFYSQMLIRETGITHLSSGDMLRNAKGPEADKIREIISRGELVPKELVLDMVFSEISKTNTNVLLDGVPRDLEQFDAVKAHAVEKNYSLRGIILNVDKEVAKGRILKRAEIEGRKDDTPETFEKRWEIYVNTTCPVIEAIKRSLPCVEINVNTPWENLSKYKQDTLLWSVLDFYFLGL